MTVSIVIGSIPQIPSLALPGIDPTLLTSGAISLATYPSWHQTVNLLFTLLGATVHFINDTGLGLHHILDLVYIRPDFIRSLLELRIRIDTLLETTSRVWDRPGNTWEENHTMFRLWNELSHIKRTINGWISAAEHTIRLLEQKG